MPFLPPTSGSRWSLINLLLVGRNLPTRSRSSRSHSVDPTTQANRLLQFLCITLGLSGNIVVTLSAWTIFRQPWTNGGRCRRWLIPWGREGHRGPDRAVGDPEVFRVSANKDEHGPGVLTKCIGEKPSRSASASQIFHPIFLISILTLDPVQVFTNPPDLTVVEQVHSLFTIFYHFYLSWATLDPCKDLVDCRNTANAPWPKKRGQLPAADFAAYGHAPRIKERQLYSSLLTLPVFCC